MAEADEKLKEVTEVSMTGLCCVLYCSLLLPACNTEKLEIGPGNGARIVCVHMHTYAYMFIHKLLPCFVSLACKKWLGIDEILEMNLMVILLYSESVKCLRVSNTTTHCVNMPILSSRNSPRIFRKSSAKVTMTMKISGQLKMLLARALWSHCSRRPWRQWGNSVVLECEYNKKKSRWTVP